MEYKNYLFADQNQEDSLQNGSICLVLSQFPPYSDLHQVKEMILNDILNDFSFITNAKVVNNVEIQCFFESMTDLIELQQGRSYGAGRAFIRQCAQSNPLQNFTLNSSEKGVFSNSEQTFESQQDCYLHSYKYIPQTLNQQEQNEAGQLLKGNTKLFHRPIQQRMTSLQDEIVELEHLRENLDLFNKNNSGHYEGNQLTDEKIGQINGLYTCKFKKSSQKNTQDTYSECDQNLEYGQENESNQQNISTNKKQQVKAVFQGQH